MEGAELIAKLQQRSVLDGEKRSANGGKHAEFIVRPLDGPQSRADRDYLFAAMEGLGAGQNVADPALLEAPHIFGSQVDAVVGEAAKKNADVAGRDFARAGG